MATLTDDELAVLNGFMYAETDSNNAHAPLHDSSWDRMWDSLQAPTPGTTLGRVVDEYVYNSGVVNELDASEGETMFTTGSEWRSIVETIRNDENLYNLKLGGMDSYNGHGSKAICFLDSDGQPYVVFKGTGGIGDDTEWPDNIQGGADASTPQQDAALKYVEEVYQRFHQSIVVTGHSKGGNKAQFVTIASDHVERCVSFDGQGFSPEFVNLYANRIEARSGCITAYNHRLDPVSALLIPIAHEGNIHYINGDYSSVASYMRTHVPIALLKFENGVLSLRDETDQSRLRKAINDLTVYLARTALPGDFEKIMSVLACVFAKGIEKPDLSVLETAEGAEAIGLLAAYLEHYDGYDELIASLSDVVSTSDLQTAGVALGALELSPGIRLILLMMLGVCASMGIVKLGEWLASHAEWVIRVDKVRRRRSPLVAHRKASGASAGVISTNQVRDFSQAKLDEMVSLIREIHSESFFDPTKWDVWYRAEAFFGRLQPQYYQGHMSDYYRKVMDINDTSVTQMRKIFTVVSTLDANYAEVMRSLAEEVSRLAKATRQLAG